MKNLHWLEASPLNQRVTCEGQALLRGFVVKVGRRAAGQKLVNVKGLCGEQSAKGFYMRWDNWLKTVEWMRILEGFHYLGYKCGWMGSHGYLFSGLNQRTVAGMAEAWVEAGRYSCTTGSSCCLQNPAGWRWSPCFWVSALRTVPAFSYAKRKKGSWWLGCSRAGGL